MRKLNKETKQLYKKKYTLKSDTSPKLTEDDIVQKKVLDEMNFCEFIQKEQERLALILEKDEESLSGLSNNKLNLNDKSRNVNREYINDSYQIDVNDKTESNIENFNNSMSNCKSKRKSNITENKIIINSHNTFNIQIPRIHKFENEKFKIKKIINGHLHKKNIKNELINIDKEYNSIQLQINNLNNINSNIEYTKLLKDLNILMNKIEKVNLSQTQKNEKQQHFPTPAISKSHENIKNINNNNQIKHNHLVEKSPIIDNLKREYRYLHNKISHIAQYNNYEKVLKEEIKYIEKEISKYDFSIRKLVPDLKSQENTILKFKSNKSNKILVLVSTLNELNYQKDKLDSYIIDNDNNIQNEIRLMKNKEI